MEKNENKYTIKMKNSFDKSSPLERRYEKIPTSIFENSQRASEQVALEIVALIQKKQAEKKPCILGLATGATPKKLYSELVKLHKEKNLSFKNVITFNLDEYYPMDPNAMNSYVYFMKKQLFEHIDILPENCHIPSGTLQKNEIIDYCKNYESKIESFGGIDLQILGIGGNGHIGFNESGSSQYSETRLVALDMMTRIAATKDFGGFQNTPRTAITLGVKKIMEAKKIILLAFSDKKSDIVAKAVEENLTAQIPASYLQNHPNALFIIDKTAAEKLTRVRKPWLVEKVIWNDSLIKKAVIDLALKTKKPVLSLTEMDYMNNGLNDLIVSQGQAYHINIKVFNLLQNTITGWPGGKPGIENPKHPERGFPKKKKVLLFSPHPDDDIISMGGTFQRLHDQGHELHVAYQTSGNIAVADSEALRFANFVLDYNQKFNIENTKAKNIYQDAKNFLKTKEHGAIDTPDLRTIKGIIRKSEATTTCHYVGLKDSQIHFMNMPFYETGTIEKKPLGKEDIQMTMDLIRKIKPHQIYVAGDLADPHGTHKVCLEAIFAACKNLKKQDKDFMKDCWVWMYRGAWLEWPVDEIEMAVPMSPEQVLQKRYGIFKHQSQKDGVVFQGTDSREFWQRAEDRNAETADFYKKLGLASYAAMEAFVRWYY